MNCDSGFFNDQMEGGTGQCDACVPPCSTCYDSQQCASCIPGTTLHRSESESRRRCRKPHA